MSYQSTGSEIPSGKFSVCSNPTANHFMKKLLKYANIRQLILEQRSTQIWPKASNVSSFEVRVKKAASINKGTLP